MIPDTRQTGRAEQKLAAEKVLGSPSGSAQPDHFPQQVSAPPDLFAVYPESRGISSLWFRSAIKKIFETLFPLSLYLPLFLTLLLFSPLAVKVSKINFQKAFKRSLWTALFFTLIFLFGPFLDSFFLSLTVWGIVLILFIFQRFLIKIFPLKAELRFEKKEIEIKFFRIIFHFFAPFFLKIGNMA